jgi:hypothetical protein
VLAAGDEAKFGELVAEMLASPKRLDRETALEALIERPLAATRPLLRNVYFELDEDGPKRDQGGVMRIQIVEILHAISDTRDVDVGVRAVDARERLFGEDSTWELRVHGLLLLADIAPEMLPYYAVEHLNDMEGPDGGEPANTAFHLLAGLGQHTVVYSWLLTSAPSTVSAKVFELFKEDAPPEIVQRYASGALDTAVKRGDDEFATVLVESIVRMELETCYPAIAALMAAKVSDELYAYVAMLLAATNRPALLAMLEEQLHRGRRPKLVVEALQVRPTPEQDAILQRWEER